MEAEAEAASYPEAEAGAKWAASKALLVIYITFKPELLPMINCVKKTKKTNILRLVNEL